MPMVTVQKIPWFKKAEKGLEGFMVTLGSVEFLIGGLKGIQTWTIIFISSGHVAHLHTKWGKTPGQPVIIGISLLLLSEINQSNNCTALAASL